MKKQLFENIGGNMFKIKSEAQTGYRGEYSEGIHDQNDIKHMIQVGIDYIDIALNNDTTSRNLGKPEIFDKEKKDYLNHIRYGFQNLAKEFGTRYNTSPEGIDTVRAKFDELGEEADNVIGTVKIKDGNTKEYSLIDLIRKEIPNPQ